MCLAIPAKVETIDGERGVVSLAGTSAQVMLTLTPEVKAGDYVLVHAGYAIAVVPENEARQTYALLREMGGLP